MVGAEEIEVEYIEAIVHTIMGKPGPHWITPDSLSV